MKELHVLSAIDKDYSWCFDQWLYDRESFQIINNELPQFQFYLVNLKERKVYGCIAFEVLEGKAISHTNAPFGGFSFSEGLAFEEQLYFTIEVNRLLKEKGIDQVLIHQSPMLKDVQKAFLERLAFLGFEEIRNRAYQILPLIKAYEASLHEMEKRKLRKAEQKMLRFEWAPESKLKEVLGFVEEQSSLLGYDFSMSWIQLREYQQKFNGHYLGATVWDNEWLVAAAILVIESAEMIYQFAPAHLKSYNKYSPVVYMTQQIFEWAKGEGFQWLNLGTSYLGLDKNEGLYQFKQNLGAETFFAPSLQKVINS